MSVTWQVTGTLISLITRFIFPGLNQFSIIRGPGRQEWSSSPPHPILCKLPLNHSFVPTRVGVGHSAILLPLRAQRGSQQAADLPT